MASTNEHHCSATPVYGLDLHRAVTVGGGGGRFLGAMLHQYGGCKLKTSALKEMVKTPTTRLSERKNLTDRCVIQCGP